MHIYINTIEKSRTARADKNTNGRPKTCNKTVTGYIFYHTSKILQTRKLQKSIFSMLFLKISKGVKFTADGRAFQTFISSAATAPLNVWHKTLSDSGERLTFWLPNLIDWLCILLLAILYDHMIMYVSLFGHSAVVFHVLCFTDICVVVYFQWHFIDLLGGIYASLFNRLIHLLTYSSTLSQRTNWGSGHPEAEAMKTPPNFCWGRTELKIKCYATGWLMPKQTGNENSKRLLRVG